MPEVVPINETDKKGLHEKLEAMIKIVVPESKGWKLKKNANQSGFDFTLPNCTKTEDKTCCFGSFLHGNYELSIGTTTLFEHVDGFLNWQPNKAFKNTELLLKNKWALVYSERNGPHVYVVLSRDPVKSKKNSFILHHPDCAQQPLNILDGGIFLLRKTREEKIHAAQSVDFKGLHHLIFSEK